MLPRVLPAWFTGGTLQRGGSLVPPVNRTGSVHWGASRPFEHLRAWKQGAQYDAQLLVRQCHREQRNQDEAARWLQVGAGRV